MVKRIKSILFVICAVTFLTAQSYHSDDKGQQHSAAPRPQQQAARETSHQEQRSPQMPSRQEAPREITNRVSVPEQERAPQRSRQEEHGPHVYAVPQQAGVPNNNLFHRQHHKHWQPRYNFYDNEYHFYPYVNIASSVELSGSYVEVGFEGQNYYYDDGTFYVQDDTGQFVAVPPPVGIIVSSLPANARQIIVDGQVFYRYKGVCYVQVAQGYQVVNQVEDPSDNS